MKVKYYLTSSGRSPVEEFILGLPEETRLEIADAVALLERGKKTQTLSSQDRDVILKRLKEIYGLEGNDC